MTVPNFEAASLRYGITAPELKINACSDVVTLLSQYPVITVAVKDIIQ